MSDDIQQTLKDLYARIEAKEKPGSLHKYGIRQSYPKEWDNVVYPPKYKPLTIEAFDGKGSSRRFLKYFTTTTEHLPKDDALQTNLFVGALQGVAYDWFCSLPDNCISSFDDLKELFLSRFYDGGMDMTMSSLMDIVQKEKEPVRAYIERFRQAALKLPPGISESVIMDSYRKNMLPAIKLWHNAPCTEWTPFITNADGAERNAKDARLLGLNFPTASDKGKRTANPSGKDSKGKQALTVNISKGKATMNAKAPDASKPKETYSFNDDDVLDLFNMLIKGKKIQLPPPKRPDEVGKVDNHKYCHYHQYIHHSTRDCYVLKR